LKPKQQLLQYPAHKQWHSSAPPAIKAAQAAHGAHRAAMVDASMHRERMSADGQVADRAASGLMAAKQTQTAKKTAFFGDSEEPGKLTKGMMTLSKVRAIYLYVCVCIQAHACKCM
jgi:hypothetical protein